MSAPESFTVFIETAGPGHAAEAMRRRFGASQSAAAQREWSGRLLGPDKTPEQVEDALGPADVREERLLGYRLPTRPDHRYEFRFAGSPPRLVGSGFERIEGRGRSQLSGSTPAQLAAELARIQGTESEVLAALGVPVNRFGWWPIETWAYSDGTELELRHGVVEGAGRVE
jgi:hypothetical protein